MDRTVREMTNFTDASGRFSNSQKLEARALLGSQVSPSYGSNDLSLQGFEISLLTCRSLSLLPRS
jgi:hypothetical protein